MTHRNQATFEHLQTVRLPCHYRAISRGDQQYTTVTRGQVATQLSARWSADFGDLQAGGHGFESR
jgi:hypothetical protein